MSSISLPPQEILQRNGVASVGISVPGLVAWNRVPIEKPLFIVIFMSVIE